MSKKPLISKKASERQHTIRGVCKRKPVTAKDYGEYLQDKKEGRMNTLIKINGGIYDGYEFENKQIQTPSPILTIDIFDTPL